MKSSAGTHRQKVSLTLRLGVETVRRAKVLASRRGTSLSALIERQIDELAAQDERYEQARRRALELMDEAGPHGGRNWTREELYAERVDGLGRRPS